jgi:hypothetical protein
VEKNEDDKRKLPSLVCRRSCCGSQTPILEEDGTISGLSMTTGPNLTFPPLESQLLRAL